MFRPGTAWNYSVAHDVLGRVVEVASGRPLDRFFDERIFGPLGMTGTGFQVKQTDHDRLATLYELDAETKMVSPDEASGQLGTSKPDYFSGGGGLVSTAPDYLRFAEMLRRRGEYEGARVLGTRTVEYMTKNHLPANADRAGFGPRSRPTRSPSTGWATGSASA